MTLSDNGQNPDETVQFVADKKVARTARDLAKRMVYLGYDQFDVRLDYSDASIKDLDQAAVQFHHDLQSPLIASDKRDSQVDAIASLLGSYLGETYVRNHGAESGRITSSDGSSTVGLRAAATGVMFAPQQRARKCLEAGESQSLLTYYAVIARELSAGPGE